MDSSNEGTKFLVALYPLCLSPVSATQKAFSKCLFFKRTIGFSYLLRTSIVVGAIHNIECAYSFYPGSKTYDLSFSSWRQRQRIKTVTATPTFYLVQEAFLHEAVAVVSAATFHLVFMKRYSLGIS